jgi:ABC-2 type transport system permease protein
MSRLLRAELIKLRTTRTFYALAGVAVGLSLLITILIASIDEPSKEDVLANVFQNDFSSLFVMILAIVGISGEWRHRTITSSLLAAPDRLKFLAAKTLAFAAAGLVLSLAISVGIGIAGYSILSLRDQVTPELGDVVDLFIRTSFVAALLGALGIGIGSLIRNQPVAIVSVLIVTFVVDNTLAALAPGVERYSPLGALPNAIAGFDPSSVGMDDVHFFAFVPALLLMLVWIGTLFALGGALLKARDVE